MNSGELVFLSRSPQGKVADGMKLYQACGHQQNRQSSIEWVNYDQKKDLSNIFQHRHCQLALISFFFPLAFFLLYLQSLDALPPLQSRMASNEPLGHYSITQSTAVSHLLLGFSIDGRLSQFLKSLFTREPCLLQIQGTPTFLAN